MSDYISKSVLKKYLRDYKWEFSLGSDFSKAIEMVDAQPTVDEKEIIRKVFERVVERLKEEGKFYASYSVNTEGVPSIPTYRAIEIVKQECGISE